jgi:kinetochore protein Spc24
MSSHKTSEVITILKQVKAFANPVDDLGIVATVQETMEATEAARADERDRIQEELSALSQALMEARSSATRPTNVPSASDHTKKMNGLDGERFNHYKSIKEAEETLASKEAELSRLKDDLKLLEAREVVDEVELDGIALRLKICNDLGFDVVTDKKTGDHKIFIRSDSGDVHCVPFDDQKTPFENSNRLWELSSS